METKMVESNKPIQTDSDKGYKKYPDEDKAKTTIETNSVYKHMINNREYVVLRFAKLKFGGVWYDGVEYTDEKGSYYVRTVKDFEKSFEKVTT